MPVKAMPREVRFWRRVKKVEGDGCWEWQAKRHPKGGYGLFVVQRESVRYALAHRVSYELSCGPIPDGMKVCHRCDNPPCVRPDHLFLGTQQDNIEDMRLKGRVAKGESHRSAKLSADKVREIRRLASRGIALSEIAARFGVRRQSVDAVVAGRTWKHVPQESDMSDTQTIGERLREPFPLATLGWKPQTVKGNRALAICYIDARDVMDRLDAVVGPENWTEQYHVLPDGSVTCRLSVRFGGEWVTKEDVGGMSEQPDQGDRLKSAFSDALKRAAVKFGIGRYLYSMPQTWCDYDPVKKQFTDTPRVPPQFLPKVQTPEDQHRAALKGARSLEELSKAWGAVPKALQARLAGDKDARKAALSARPAEQPPLTAEELDRAADEEARDGALFDGGRPTNLPD